MSTAIRVRCPRDDWEFPPRYTDGVCPLCGWRPEGVADESTWWERIDWFVVMLVATVVVSVVMGVLVLVAYSRA